MSKLTAVIPATNAPPTLDRCRRALAAASTPPDEVIVVDAPAHAGPARARNDGARRANGDLIVFVDADVEVHPDAIALIRARFARDPGLAAIFGSYDDDPFEPDVVSTYRNLLHHHVHHASAGSASTFWAGLGAVRRDAFLAVGGFDERLFPVPSIEDVELGARLVAAGSRIELDPSIQGTHLKRWTLVDMTRTDVLRRGAPWVALLLESRVHSTALNLGWRQRISSVACVACVAAGAAGRPRPAIAAAGAFVAVNRSLFVLVARRRGAVASAASVPLHAVHHLAAAAAVPAGLVLHLRRRAAARDAH